MNYNSNGGNLMNKNNNKWMSLLYSSSWICRDCFFSLLITENYRGKCGDCSLILSPKRDGRISFWSSSQSICMKWLNNELQRALHSRNTSTWSRLVQKLLLKLWHCIELSWGRQLQFIIQVWNLEWQQLTSTLQKRETISMRER